MAVPEKSGTSRGELEPIKVAFGSFHFGLSGSGESPKTIRQYLDGVCQALESISSIEEVEMPSPGQSYTAQPLEVPDELPDFSKRGDFFPCLAQGQDIRFTLRIPRRTQREVFRALKDDDFGERFEVTMNHDWGHPLAMVLPTDPGQGGVSWSVAVVREFMRREFERIDAGPICFQCMGPSPAHVDFFLVAAQMEGQRSNDTFEVLSYERRGYSQFTIGYNAAQLGDRIEVAHQWFRRISIELAFYYRIFATRNRQMFDWMELVDAVDGIVKTQRRGGLQAFLARTFRRKPTNDALIDLALFEMEELKASQSIERQMSKRYGESERGLLEPLVKYTADELQRRPVNQMAGLLQRFENRRVTDRDLVFVVVSSVIGAVVGAAATLVAAG